MDRTGWKQQIEEAKSNSQPLKITFFYPHLLKIKFHRGRIIKVSDDCFTIDDVRNGPMSFSYDFISEIAPWDYAMAKEELNQ